MAKRSHATYFAHDADPLVSVAEAWGRYFEGAGRGGGLEVAVSETLARWRAGSLELPDYYLVCSPEDWPPVRRHWYLGVLADACALRVVTTTGGADLGPKLAGLPAGRWWPELDRLLAGIEPRVPDQVGGGGSPASTIADMAAGALPFLDAMNLHMANLLGFSIRGFVDQEMALTLPSAANSLVLASSAPRGAPGRRRRAPEVIGPAGAPEPAADVEHVLHP
jgi:hypothetical protein